MGRPTTTSAPRRSQSGWYEASAARALAASFTFFISDSSSRNFSCPPSMRCSTLSITLHEQADGRHDASIAARPWQLPGAKGMHAAAQAVPSSLHPPDQLLVLAVQLPQQAAQARHEAALRQAAALAVGGRRHQHRVQPRLEGRLLLVHPPAGRTSTGRQGSEECSSGREQQHRPAARDSAPAVVPTSLDIRPPVPTHPVW